MDPFGMVYLVGLPAGACIIWCYQTYSKYKQNKRIIKMETEQGWKYIGKVQFMCVYPIDGGRAYKEEQAYFGQFGLRTNPIGEKATYDRGYILYKRADQPTAILRNRIVSKATNRNQKVNHLWNLLKVTSATLTPRLRLVNVQYLDGTMTVHDAGDILARQVRRVFGITDESIRIGYYPQDYKKTFNRITKMELLNRADGYCCLGNYSSFTMVNSESINDLRKKTGRADLSYKNFRPQVVFKGLRPYIEDGARHLKIGDLEFSNVTPCIYSKDVNFTFNSKMPRSLVRRAFRRKPRNRPEVQHKEPFHYLKNNRQLHTLDVHFAGSDLPSFGINFECDTESEGLTNEQCPNGHFIEDPPNLIKNGYNVYVKY